MYHVYVPLSLKLSLISVVVSQPEIRIEQFQSTKPFNILALNISKVYLECLQEYLCIDYVSRFIWFSHTNDAEFHTNNVKALMIRSKTDIDNAVLTLVICTNIVYV